MKGEMDLLFPTNRQKMSLYEYLKETEAEVT